MLWDLPIDGTGDLILAGSRLYAGNSNQIQAIDLPTSNSKAAVSWAHPVGGAVSRLLAANGMLFAVTLDGQVLAFGQESASGAPVLKEEPAALKRASKANAQWAKGLAKDAQSNEGYPLLQCGGHADLLRALVQRQFQVTVVDQDPERVAALRTIRKRLRTALHRSHGRSGFLRSASYFAHVVMVGESFPLVWPTASPCVAFIIPFAPTAVSYGFLKRARVPQAWPA